MTNHGAPHEVTPKAVSHSVLEKPAHNPCDEADRPYVLAATILASAMAFIDGTVVNIALPSIQTDLNASFAAMQWVVNGYLLFMSSLILVGGAMGDRFGRRRLFMIGVGLFAVASLACAISPTIEVLIVSRAVQGLGAALMVPQSLAIIAASFPRAVRGRAIGIWSGASAITTSLGPALGGLLIELADWRAIFWINLPICMIVLVLAKNRVPESRVDGIKGPLDWQGALLAVIGFGCLALGLTLVGEARDDTGNVASMLFVGALLGIIGFLWRQKRAEAPLMPLGLFRSRLFFGINVMTLFLYAALSGVLFLLPFELIANRQLSPATVGMILLPFGLIIGLLSRFAGAWADRHGPDNLLIAGSTLVTLAIFVMAMQLTDLTYGVIAPIVVMAIGMGLVAAPLTAAVINAAPDEYSGAASGVSNAASRISGLLAIALFGMLASMVYGAIAHAIDPKLVGDALHFGRLPEPGTAGRKALLIAFSAAYQTAMLACMLSGAMAIATGFFIFWPKNYGASGN